MRIIATIFTLAVMLCAFPVNVQAQEVQNIPYNAQLNGLQMLPEDPEFLKMFYSQEVAGFSMEGLEGNQYIHNSRYNGYTIRNGIDVSYYQGDIDWKAVKSSGVEFAFIRVAYRGYGSEGTLMIDTNAAKNMKEAAAAGIKVGVYIFSQAINVEEAEEEAKFLLREIAGYSITMPVVIDYEYASNNIGRLYNANLSRGQMTEIVNAFCSYIKNAGYEPMVYTNKSMLDFDLNREDIPYKLWLSHVCTETSYQGEYDYWQYTHSGRVNGITGEVDCNFWYDNPNDDIVSDNPTNSDSQMGWVYSDGKKYWFDNGVMACDKEVYDPESDAWYWFDADGVMATNKDVFIPTNSQRTEGKWVRYDAEGRMVKGEDYRYGGWYWFDPQTGEMIKGFVNIPDGTQEGKWVYYDDITGQMHHGESYIYGNWYYFDDITGKMVHGEYQRNGNWYYYDMITGIMHHGWVVMPDGQSRYYDEVTGILRQ